MSKNFKVKQEATQKKPINPDTKAEGTKHTTNNIKWSLIKSQNSKLTLEQYMI